jgi:FAD/FMN-containing dehydrogenase
VPEVINWSGSIRCQPASLRLPGTGDEVVQAVRDAIRQGQTVRPMGSRHSSSPLFETHECVVSLDQFSGLIDVDRDRRQATFKSGTTLEEAGQQLAEHNLAFPNLGDIDQQTLAGVIATGTHGTGKSLQNLATMLIGGELVDGRGIVHRFAVEEQPELVNSLRVSIGALGILTEVRLQLVQARNLFRHEWCSQIDDMLPHLDALIDQNHCFDFYWYPRSDRVKLRTINLKDVPRHLPFATRVERDEGRAHEIIAQRRRLKFEEMEYAVPADAGRNCFHQIRERVKERHRRHVGWRVLYRTVAQDSAWLSPAHGRETVTISILQNATLPSEAYFNDIESIFRAHGGRPHWGKKHRLRARELRDLYPYWDDFAAMRAQLDPHNLFLTPAMRDLLVLDDSDRET